MTLPGSAVVTQGLVPTVSSVHNIDMNLAILHERDIIAVDKTEQAVAWLVENGPLVTAPPIPVWIMRRLTDDRRILRLRRGTYLVPTEEGRLPSLGRAMNLLDADGYISGHAALAAQGLNDQDIPTWWALATRRQADITYGHFAGHFVYSPGSATSGERHTVPLEGEAVVMATPTQALVDEARLIPFGFDWVETGRVLRNAVDVRRTDEAEVKRVLAQQPSLAAARRLGLLFELVRGRPDPDLLRIARRTTTVSVVSGGRFVDREWRIKLPLRRDDIRRAMQ